MQPLSKTPLRFKRKLWSAVKGERESTEEHENEKEQGISCPARAETTSALPLLKINSIGPSNGLA